MIPMAILTAAPKRKSLMYITLLLRIRHFAKPNLFIIPNARALVAFRDDHMPALFSRRIAQSKTVKINHNSCNMTMPRTLSRIAASLQVRVPLIDQSLKDTLT